MSASPERDHKMIEPSVVLMACVQNELSPSYLFFLDLVTIHPKLVLVDLMITSTFHPQLSL